MGGLLYRHARVWGLLAVGWVVAGCVLAGLGVFAPSALAVRPWWSLSSASRPGVLGVGGESASEVAGNLLRVRRVGTCCSRLSEEGIFLDHAIVPFDVTAEELQGELERIDPGGG